MIKINTVLLLGLEDRIGNELTWTTLSVLHNQVTDPHPTPKKNTSSLGNRQVIYERKERERSNLFRFRQIIPSMCLD